MVNLQRGVEGVFVIYFLVGLVLTVLAIAPPFGAMSDFLFIFFAALVVFLAEVRVFGARATWLKFAWVGIVSAVIESVGTLTGFPFGAYVYTEAFGPRLAGVLPLAIPLAWWIVVMPSFRLLDSLFAGKRWLCIVSTALLVVLVDFVIEPMAVVLKGYWVWEAGDFYYGVPLSNFIGWLLTALIIVFGLTCFKRHPMEADNGGVLLRHFLLLTAVLVFFVVTLAAAGFWPPVFLGLGLIAASAVFLRIARRREETHA